jgi:DNA-binding transcriptional MerR regulator
MPLIVGGLTYLTPSEVCQLVGVSRQTLWRWRQDALIPPGQRLRGHRLLFSPDEVEQIQTYASALEPAGQRLQTQLALFRSEGGGAE